MAYHVNGGSYRYKSEAVKKILNESPTILKSFEQTHGINREWVDSLTETQSNTYGDAGFGDLCDKILLEGGARTY